MGDDRLTTLPQKDPYTSPWPLSVRLKVLLWAAVRLFLFRPTPKQLKRWRNFLLRLFGARIEGTPYVAPSARIKMPWNLTMEDHACLGPESEVYNLGEVVLRERCTVSQQAYLCGGTHDFEHPALPLVVGPIEIGRNAFLGARAFVLPGITVGDDAIVGACAVVTKDVPPGEVWGGNPARFIKKRPLKAEGGR